MLFKRDIAPIIDAGGIPVVQSQVNELSSPAVINLVFPCCRLSETAFG